MAENLLQLSLSLPTHTHIFPLSMAFCSFVVVAGFFNNTLCLNDKYCHKQLFIPRDTRKEADRVKKETSIHNKCQSHEQFFCKIIFENNLELYT